MLVTEHEDIQTTTFFDSPHDTNVVCPPGAKLLGDKWIQVDEDTFREFYPEWFETNWWKEVKKSFRKTLKRWCRKVI